MKTFVFILIFFGLNPVWAAPNFKLKECLGTPGNTIGTRENGPADVVLLIPGAGARGTILHLGDWMDLNGYYDQIAKILYGMNVPFEVIPADPHGNESVEERAVKLVASVKRYAAKGHKILLLGHSLGGLVARVALRDESIHPLVSAAVSVSTPHQGDVFIDWLGKDTWESRSIVLMAKTGGFDMHKQRYFFQLSVKQAPTWNMAADFNPSMPRHFSVVTAQGEAQLVKSLPFFGVSNRIIREEMDKRDLDQGPWGNMTDGLVPAYSQVWGECLAWMPLNHMTSLGKVIVPGAKARHKSAWKELFLRLKDRGLLKIPDSFASTTALGL